jgi:SAM-dependent methyltransferase
MQCNICGSRQFEDWRGKTAELCRGCGAKARHRVALDVYERLLFPFVPAGGKVLHLAPEQCLFGRLKQQFGQGYLPADASPERYPHTKPMQLVLPQGLAQFGDGAFAAILHNHVLEHVPGHWADHVAALLRVLAKGGRMIFSVPGPYLDRDTIEGGELLKSDKERLERFLQEDHFRLFGRDFVARLKNWPGVKWIEDGTTDARRREIGVRPGKAPFYILEKQVGG